MPVVPLELDRFDRHILNVLQQEGRISNQELAERIGLSPSPCLRGACARGARLNYPISGRC